MARIAILVTDRNRYHPAWVDAILAEQVDDHDVVGLTPYPVRYSESILDRRLFIDVPRHLGLSQTWHALRDLAEAKYKIWTGQRPSVRQVARRHDVPVIETNDLHSEHYLETLRGLDIDIIITSIYKILEPSLLNLPRLGILNRHASYLPENRGMAPVFFTGMKDDSTYGETIHLMQESLDTGPIMARKRLDVNPAQKTFDHHYRKAFEASPDLVGQAVERLVQGNEPIDVVCSDGSRGSYHTYPDDEQWQRFAQNGWAMI